MSWRPISREKLESIVDRDLSRCTPEQKALFSRYRVPFQETPILRFGKEEKVFVIARRENEVLYYEDVEEGFEVTTLNNKGAIEELGANQDELSFALKKWFGV